MIWVWIGMLFGAAAVIWLGGEIARVRAANLEAQAILREESYRAIGRLVDDPATPDEYITDLSALLKVMNSRLVMWRVLRHALAGKLRPDGHMAREYRALTPHLRKDYLMAWVAGILSITFNNMLLGAFIRRTMFYSVPHEPDADVADCQPVGPVAYDLIHSAGAAA